METDHTHRFPPLVGGGYALRTVTVVDDLSELHGPLEGQVRLPKHLDWSPQGVYDIGRADWRRLLYEIVLEEAADAEDLRRWINRDELIESWPRLFLPGSVRTAWETKHPVLARRRRAS